MRVKAAVLRTTGGPLSIETLSLGALRDDEVLVRVVATGICHTDVAMRDSPTRVPKPIVLGHEGAGVVEEVGRSVRRLKPGEPVVMTFSSCGCCPSCDSGDPAYCDHTGPSNFSGRRHDGTTALNAEDDAVHSHFFGQSSFATYAVCTERNAIAVADDVPLELLGPFGCGFQTGAGAVLDALRIAPGRSIAIFGVGSVGLAAVMAAKIAGASIIVAVDTQETRLRLAAELGATHTLNPRDCDLGAQLKAVAARGLNYAIDTSGNLEVVRQAVQSLAPRGVCGLISSAKGGDASLNILHLMLGGRVVRGIHQGDSVPQLLIPRLIQFHREGRFPVEKLTKFYDLEQINQAIDDMEKGKTIKPIIRMA